MLPLHGPTRAVNVRRSSPWHPADSLRVSSNARIWAALLAVYVVWGSTYLAIRVAVETLPPFLMAGVRHLVAGIVLYAFAIRRGRPGGRPPDAGRAGAPPR